MKVKRIKIASLVATAVILVAIWLFSAQSAAESSNLSGSLAQFLMKMPFGDNLALVEDLDHILRKMAHFTIYMLLGISLAGTMIDLRKGRLILTVVLSGVVVAMLDEWHQSFVPGRGPGWGDVLLDTAGVLAGACLVVGLRWLVGRKYRKGPTSVGPSRPRIQ